MPTPKRRSREHLHPAGLALVVALSRDRAARPMTDEAIARALKLDLSYVRTRLRWLESLENGAQVWRDGQDFWTERD
jgi:hypothetical protein